jgi:hypothetical protein
VTGILTPGALHRLHLTIPFAPDNQQPFDLAYHTWEDGVFSGTTQWGGRTFGVQAFRGVRVTPSLKRRLSAEALDVTKVSSSALAAQQAVVAAQAASRIGTTVSGWPR